MIGAMKLKEACILEGKLWQTYRQPIIKHHFADKGLYRQSYGFSSSHVQMWELEHKEGWVPKNWCFWTVALENLRVPWTAMRSYQSNLKEINPEYSLEGLMLKFQYLGHLMQRADSLEKTLMLRKIESKRRRGWQRRRWMDDITDSMDLSLSTLGDSEGQGSLACCSPWGRKELDTTKWLNKSKELYVSLQIGSYDQTN